MFWSSATCAAVEDQGSPRPPFSSTLSTALMACVANAMATRTSFGVVTRLRGDKSSILCVAFHHDAGVQPDNLVYLQQLPILLLLQQPVADLQQG